MEEEPGCREERRRMKGEEARTGGEAGQTEEGNLERENVRKGKHGLTGKTTPDLTKMAFSVPLLQEYLHHIFLV